MIWSQGWFTKAELANALLSWRLGRLPKAKDGSRGADLLAKRGGGWSLEGKRNESDQYPAQKIVSLELGPSCLSLEDPFPRGIPRAGPGTAAALLLAPHEAVTERGRVAA